MASGLYQSAVADMLDGTMNIDTDTVKLMLVDNTYTYDPDTVFVDEAGASDIIDAEISVTGYTGGFGGAGRKTVAIALQANNTNNRVDIELNGGADLTWTALGAGATIEAAVLIKEITNDAASPCIAYFDISNVVTNGGDVTLQMTSLASGGNIRFAM